MIYCGGCNPEIDRVGLIKSLSRKTGLAVQAAGRPCPEVDLLIAVSGCTCGCAPVPANHACKRAIVVAGLSIDGWPVSQKEIEDILIEKVINLMGK